MRFIPLGNRVLVKPFDAGETTTEGGIILQEARSEKPYIGDVVAIGDEVLNAQVGDRIYYARFAGTDIELETKYLLLEMGDVLGVLK